jgi:uncharacterized repeat protein (TIGR03803 family)
LLLAGCGGAQGPAPVPNAAMSARAPGAKPAVAAAGIKTILYSFTGGHDGALPVGALLWDGSHFWGITEAGGTVSCGCGVVYAINPNNPSRLELYQFNGGTDGAYPESTPTIAGKWIVGTTTFGGGTCAERSGGCGTVWALDPSTGFEHVAHAFTGADGMNPMGLSNTFPDDPRSTTQLVGVAKNGGSDRSCHQGCGTNFVAYPEGGRFLATSMIAKFGANPAAAPLRNSYLRSFVYTATEGGKTDCARGCGSAVDYSTPEYVFDYFRPDIGYDPEGGVTNDVSSDAKYQVHIYGTTISGGSPTCSCGTIYRITLAYKPSDPGLKNKIIVDHVFEGGSDGAKPLAPLVAAGSVYYGTTLLGGGEGCGGLGCGTVYEFNPETKAYRVVYRFAGGPDGSHPGGLAYLKGTIYGVTSNGGEHGHGTIFALKP